MDDSSQGDICRVCRSEGTPEKPLFHPCICTGSIKFIHQECLVQWLKYSEKEYCELCNYRFSFIPIYSPDMPKRLPFRDIINGLFGSLATAVRFWLHYTLVATAWLGIVPLTAYRIYKCLFSGSFSAVLTLPLDLLSTENLISDGFYGCCVVTCTLCSFISLVWLREQILRGGGPEWLEPQLEQLNQNQNEPQPLNQNDNHPAAADNNPPADDEEENGAAADEGIEGDADPLLGDEEEDPGDDGVGAAVVADDPDLADVDHVVDDGVGAGGAGGQDDMGWNQMEWDRAAEDLTWERILGLDGSLVFLEHVFWVISLNAIFIFVFAFCPYHMGQFTLIKMDMTSLATASQFEGLVTTLCGYLVIGFCLVLLHFMTSLLRFKKTERILGLCYVVVKVSLLSVFEIGVFPLVCGWWLDICSLPMLGASLEDRKTSLKSAPGTSMFIHWLVGMVYVFYFASFILLLREVVRPGVLWFLQNLNDPDFNPIQEMIHLPIIGHMRRFLASLVIFGTTVLLMIWFPVCIVQKVLVGFLPYNVSIVNSNDSPVSELSLEFLLLQLVLPALLDHGHLRQWLKVLIRTWCVVISYFLDLRSYLLGDVPLPTADGTGDVAGVEGVVQPRNDVTNQPYLRPSLFGIRVASLLVLTGASLLLGGLVVLTVPVITGRKLIGLWMGEIKVHELNTAACGLYVGLLVMRIVTLLCSWVPRGWSAILLKVKEALIILSKTFLAGVVLLGVIPLLIGILFDVVIIVPIRVPLNQSPIFYLWQDWAFGVLHTKVICGIAMMGEWRLKEVLEEIYHAGIININMRLILVKLALPVIVALGLALALPYVAVAGLSPFFNMTPEAQTVLLRRVYPFLLMAAAVIYLIQWQIFKFIRLYEHIKNDKYLVGKRLVNYDPKRNLPKQPSVDQLKQHQQVINQRINDPHLNPPQPL